MQHLLLFSFLFLGLHVGLFAQNFKKFIAAFPELTLDQKLNYQTFKESEVLDFKTAHKIFDQGFVVEYYPVGKLSLENGGYLVFYAYRHNLASEGDKPWEDFDYACQPFNKNGKPIHKGTANIVSMGSSDDGAGSSFQIEKRTSAAHSYRLIFTTGANDLRFKITQDISSEGQLEDKYTE